MSENFKSLEDMLGYKFKNQDLLKRALTHSSTGHKSTGKTRNYERLEFLGDRVLGLIMADTLFHEFFDESEGNLAKRHSALVQGKTLYDIAAEKDLGRFIIMSETERNAGGGENENILADVLEALLAALYLDGGIDVARKITKEWWGERVHVMNKAPQDSKTELQEWVQARSLPLPVYEVISRDGPDHAPIFNVAVDVKDEDPLHASASSRREAEKQAADAMLQFLKQKYKKKK